MIIYRATNLVNGKVYIGQTVQKLHQRRNQHVSCALRKDRNDHIGNALMRYGADKFSWEIIDRAENIDELNHKEEFWINELSSMDRKIGYNIRSGGLNNRISDETKIKIGNAHRGRKHTQEFKDRISARQLGQKRGPRSEETKRKISESNKGKIISQSTREKLRQHNLGKKQTQESIYKKVLATRGEKCYCSKLTEISAIQILDRLESGESQRKLAAEFGVTDGAIYRLKTGKSWKHLFSDREKLSPVAMGGSTHPNSKINNELAAEIKRMIAKGCKAGVISRTLNVSRSIVYAIKYNKTWKDVPWPSDNTRTK